MLLHTRFGCLSRGEYRAQSLIIYTLCACSLRPTTLEAMYQVMIAFDRSPVNGPSIDSAAAKRYSVNDLQRDEIQRLRLHTYSAFYPVWADTASKYQVRLLGVVPSFTGISLDEMPKAPGQILSPTESVSWRTHIPWHDVEFSIPKHEGRSGTIVSACQRGYSNEPQPQRFLRDKVKRVSPSRSPKRWKFSASHPLSEPTRNLAKAILFG